MYILTEVCPDESGYSPKFVDAFVLAYDARRVMKERFEAAKKKYPEDEAKIDTDQANVGTRCYLDIYYRHPIEWTGIIKCLNRDGIDDDLCEALNDQWRKYPVQRFIPIFKAVMSRDYEEICSEWPDDVISREDVIENWEDWAPRYLTWIASKETIELIVKTVEYGAGV